MARYTRARGGLRKGLSGGVFGRSRLAVAVGFCAAIALSALTGSTLPAHGVPADTALVTSVTPSTTRNDFNGWVGFRVQGGTSDISVTALGRWVLAGNSQSHAVRLVLASTGADVATATVNTSGQPAAAFAFTTLATPVTLSANTAYYLLSQETAGGDAWYDFNAAVATTAAAAATGTVWATTDAPAAFTVGGGSNQSYGVPNLRYTTSAAAPVVTQQPQDQTVAAGNTAVFSAGASGSPAPTVQWESKPSAGSFAPIAGATSTVLTVPNVTVGDSGTQYHAVFTNTSGSVTTNAATLTVTASPPPDGTALVTYFSPSTLRNDFSGWVGMRIQGGASDISVTALGRWVASGNSQSHAVRLVLASTGADVATATVNTSGQPANAFTFTALTTPVTLSANTTYYLLSQETAGGDAWYDFNTSTITTSAASDTGTVWTTTAAPATFNTGGSAGQSYVVPNLKYTTPTAAPVVTQQPQDQTVTAGNTAVFSAAASGSPAPTVQWESKPPAAGSFAPIGGATSTVLTVVNPTVADSGTQYHAVFTNGSGSVTTNAATLTVNASPPAGGTALITYFSPSTLRNDFSGWVGLRVQGGASDISVTALGRWVVSGNSQSHAVRLVLASTGADVATATVNTSGQPAGAFAFTTLTTPVTLSANTTYYLLTQEAAGGDTWYDFNASTITTSAASDTGTVWATNAAPATFNAGGTSGQAYGVPNLRYVALNHAPVAVADGPYSVNEDATTTVPAPGVLANDTDADPGTTLTAVLVSGPTHAASFTLNADGSFSYAPAANYNGADSFTYKANDGTADSNTVTASITVNAVNDAPSFTKGADQTVLEDAGAQTVTSWATSISAGPPDESGQTLAFTVTNGNNPLFSAQPALSSTGTLTYTPAANANGTATVTVTLKDNGGTANGGVDTSAPQTFTINVTAVNDPPSFTKGADQTVLEDAGAQTVTNWATAIAAGPANESTQTVAFTVTNNNNAMFSTQPAVSSTGTLTYQSAPDANGTASVTVTLKDNGGTANGGNDTSAPQTFNINVTPVNDAPRGVADATHAVTGNVKINAPAPGLLTGVTDVEGDTLIPQVDASNASLGNITINSDGSYTYNPKPGHEGTDTVKFKVCDNGTPTACSAVHTLTLTVTNMIWFVDNNVTTNGDGRLGTPFKLLSDFQSLNDGTGDHPAANDSIFLDRNVATDYVGPVTLLNGQKLFGKGGTAAIASMAGITLAPDSATLPTTSGTAPRIVTTTGTLNAVNLNGAGGSNTIRGISIGNTTGAGIAGASFGTLTATETAVGPSRSGAALNLSAGTLNSVTFSDVSSTSGASAVTLGNIDGNLTISAGSITGYTANGFLIQTAGGSATISYAGTIGNGSGTSVNISGKDAGTTTFSGSITQGGTGAGISMSSNTGGTTNFTGAVTVNGGGAGVNLATNSGATISFSGGVVISGGANAAFAATGGGTVGVTGTNNTLATTTGVALNVANTTISSNGLAFKSISAGTSASGPANGIVLNNTGSNAGLTVAGTGSANSGGTIQKTTGAGVLLTSTKSPSFNNLQILNTGASGVDGTQLTNFTFTNGAIDNSGTGHGVDNSNIGLNHTGTGTEQNVTGTVVITGNSLTNAYYQGIDVYNYNGTIDNATISSNTITSSTSTASSKGGGIRFIANGNASTVANITKATLDSNVITNFPSGVGLQVQCGNANSPSAPADTCGTVGDSTKVINVTNNRVAGASSAVKMGAEGMVFVVNGRGQGNFNITGNGTVANPITNVTGQAISLSSFGFANVAATISNNVIVANNTVASPGIGVGTSKTFSSADTPLLTATITNNNVSSSDGNGILAVARDATGTLKVKIQNNTVGAPLSGVRPGIRVDAGNASSVDDAVCANISGNTSAGSGGTQGIGLRKNGTVTTTNDFAVNGMTATASPGVENYVNGLNPAGGGTLLISATSGFSNCSLP